MIKRKKIEDWESAEEQPLHFWCRYRQRRECRNSLFQEKFGPWQLFTVIYFCDHHCPCFLMVEHLKQTFMFWQKISSVRSFFWLFFFNFQLYVQSFMSPLKSAYGKFLLKGKAIFFTSSSSVIGTNWHISWDFLHCCHLIYCYK